MVNKIQWSFNRNQYIVFQENAFEIVFCELEAIFLGETSWNATGAIPTFMKSYVYLTYGCT